MEFSYKGALLTMAAANFPQLVDFYRQLLQQDPNPYLSEKYAEFQLQSLRLGIFQPRADRRGEFAASTPSSLSLCLEVSNLKAAIAHLQSLGWPPPGEILQASHGREIYAYDPEGNRLILHEE
ncbi:MAG: VOC family protein [Chloroflexaceae bacterium]|nr:VOC family protein [Chloroflexaceae bacterium]